MKIFNVEVKAKCEDLGSVRKYLKKNHTKFLGIDHQVDTYFVCQNGRLKLREGNIENRLLHYGRENKAGPKQSHVTLFENKPKSMIKELLTNALGILVVVDKKREIYFIDNVKFHIDVVKSLGSFIEIEAIGKEGELKHLNKQCNFFIKELGVNKRDLLNVSYSDLLIKKSA